MSRVTAKQVASSTLALPADTFIYALARLQTSYAAISSNDALTIFDPRTLGINTQIANAHRGLTCLCANDGKFFTAGRDGNVRVWDSRTDSATRTASLTLTTPNGTGLSALAAHSHFIAAGNESDKEGLGDVSVLLWDTRNASQPIRNYAESHTDSITSLAFSKQHPTRLLSGSTDGLVSLFDTTQSDEDDAVLQVLNHGAAVHVSGFLDERVYAISTDEQMSVYTLSDPTDDQDTAAPVHVLGDLRARLTSKYVVNLVAGDFVASGNTEREKLVLTPLSGVLASDGDDVLDVPGTVELEGAHGEEVVRDVLLDAGMEKVFTCGEDGNVRVWAVPSASGHDAATNNGAKTKKRKSHKTGYKPY